MMKQTISLGGAWRMHACGSDQWHDAQVPGSVYADLMADGTMPDPFYRDNEMDALKLMDNDFYYSRTFAVGEELLNSDAVILRCEGLDTLATLYINGDVVGIANNMHRIWEYDVKKALQVGENTIEVRFASPTKYIKEAYEKSVADGSSDAMVGFPHIRKAHCMFGWDWGPRLPDAGIWRDIDLLGINVARIRDVHVL